MLKHALIISTIASFPRAAWAGGGAVPPQLATTCGDHAKGAKNAVVIGRHEGEVAYQISLPGGPAIASLTGGEDPCSGAAQCTILPIKKSAPHLTAKLGAGGASATAIVLLEDASDGPIGSILALRGAHDKLLDAIRVPDGCAASMKALSIVPGQQSIFLTCRVAAGSGAEQDLVVHVVDGKLTIMISLDGGATDLDPSHRGPCQISAVGGAAVVKTASGPRLRVTRAPDGGQKTVDGHGPACEHQSAIEQDYQWDADQKALVSDGPGRPFAKDTCGCTP